MAPRVDLKRERRTSSADVTVSQTPRTSDDFLAGGVEAGVRFGFGVGLRGWDHHDNSRARNQQFQNEPSSIRAFATLSAISISRGNAGFNLVLVTTGIWPHAQDQQGLGVGGRDHLSESVQHRDGWRAASRAGYVLAPPTRPAPNLTKIPRNRPMYGPRDGLQPGSALGLRKNSWLAGNRPVKESCKGGESGQAGIGLE